MTFFSLITSFCLFLQKESPAPPSLLVSSDGIIHHSPLTNKFMVGDVVSIRLKEDCGVNLCPRTHVNDSDGRSYFSTSYVPWPVLDEYDIFRGHLSATESSLNFKLENQIPGYVKNTLEQLHQSETITDTIGNVQDNTINEDGVEHVFENYNEEIMMTANESLIMRVC